MKYFRILIILFFSACISFSCLQDAPDNFENPDTNWNPSFSFPVGYTALQMNEDSGFDSLLLLTNPTTGYPFWVDEENIPMSYTMPFDLQEISSFSEQIIRIMFRLNSYNGFPADARGQIYFLDYGYQVVDSMFTDGPLTMQAGSPEGNGETVDPIHDQNDVIFDQDKINDLVNVRHIVIEGAILNFALDSSLIQYYPDYSIEVQLGVQVELNMSL